MWKRKDPPPGYTVYQAADNFWRVAYREGNGPLTVFTRADGTDRAYKYRMHANEFAWRRYNKQQAGEQKA